MSRKQKEKPRDGYALAGAFIMSLAMPLAPIAYAIALTETKSNKDAHDSVAEDFHESADSIGDGLRSAGKWLKSKL